MPAARNRDLEKEGASPAAPEEEDEELSDDEEEEETEETGEDSFSEDADKFVDPDLESAARRFEVFPVLRAAETWLMKTPMQHMALCATLLSIVMLGVIIALQMRIQEPLRVVKTNAMRQTQAAEALHTMEQIVHLDALYTLTLVTGVESPASVFKLIRELLSTLRSVFENGRSKNGMVLPQDPLVTRQWSLTKERVEKVLTDIEVMQGVASLANTTNAAGNTTQADIGIQYATYYRDELGRKLAIFFKRYASLLNEAWRGDPTFCSCVSWTTYVSLMDPLWKQIDDAVTHRSAVGEFYLAANPQLEKCWNASSNGQFNFTSTHYTILTELADILDWNNTVYPHYVYDMTGIIDGGGIQVPLIVNQFSPVDVDAALGARIIPTNVHGSAVYNLLVGAAKLFDFETLDFDRVYQETVSTSVSHADWALGLMLIPVAIIVVYALWGVSVLMRKKTTVTFPHFTGSVLVVVVLTVVVFCVLVARSKDVMRLPFVSVAGNAAVDIIRYEQVSPILELLNFPLYQMLFKSSPGDKLFKARQYEKEVSEAVLGNKASDVKAYREAVNALNLLIVEPIRALKLARGEQSVINKHSNEIRYGTSGLRENTALIRDKGFGHVDTCAWGVERVGALAMSITLDLEVRTNMHYFIHDVIINHVNPVAEQWAQLLQAVSPAFTVNRNEKAIDELLHHDTVWDAVKAIITEESSIQISKRVNGASEVTWLGVCAVVLFQVVAWMMSRMYVTPHDNLIVW